MHVFDTDKLGLTYSTIITKTNLSFEKNYINERQIDQQCNKLSCSVNCNVCIWWGKITYEQSFAFMQLWWPSKQLLFFVYFSTWEMAVLVYTNVIRNYIQVCPKSWIFIRHFLKFGNFTIFIKYLITSIACGIYSILIKKHKS